MKANSKQTVILSSCHPVSLSADDMKLVEQIKARLRLESDEAVVRAALRALIKATERNDLRERFRAASLATRHSLRAELDDLDPLAGENLD